MIVETLARRYSAALFSIAREYNELEEVFDEFTVINESLETQNKFRHFLFSPKIDAAEKKHVLQSIFGKNVSPALLNFMFLLIDKKRQTLMMKIYRHFVILYNNYHKKAVVIVRPAVALEPALLAGIEKVFEQILKRTVTVREEVDPTIIGGLQIRVNNTIYDATIAHSLRTLSHKLLC